MEHRLRKHVADCRWETTGPDIAMAKHLTSRPPRLVPDQPFPPYAYIPGRTAHPTRDPDGHSYGVILETPDSPDPTAWQDCHDYLYGIDLFNHGFYWEAHEAWEGLWVACGRRGQTKRHWSARSTTIGDRRAWISRTFAQKFTNSALRYGTDRQGLARSPLSAPSPTTFVGRAPL